MADTAARKLAAGTLCNLRVLAYQLETLLISLIRLRAKQPKAEVAGNA